MPVSGQREQFTDFWEERAQAFSTADPEGWAAVCHRGAAVYYNRFIDWSQRRACRRLLDRATLAPGAPAVDVGCGTGRWTRVVMDRGLEARGFDLSPTMVKRAGELVPGASFDVAPATALPVADETQQLVTAITVLHHLPHADQPDAVAEIARVLQPGGACVVIVLLDAIPGGSWCYPRSRRGWEELFESHGLSSVHHVGEEFFTPALVLHLLAAGLASRRRRRSAGSDPGIGSRRAPLASLYRAIERLAVLVSYPLEGALQRWWPGAPATGVASLYVKQS
jgi:SAM-dependent methyltransferase